MERSTEGLSEEYRSYSAYQSSEADWEDYSLKVVTWRSELVVRVRVRLKPVKGRLHASIETAAIANAGYESDVPEVVIPELLAERLGLFPELPSGTRIEAYQTAGGEVRVHYIPDALETSVLTEDRVEGPVLIGVAISGEEDEVLLSDKLIDALKLDLCYVGKGLWRFADEPPSMIRGSVRPEEWGRRGERFR